MWNFNCDRKIVIVIILVTYINLYVCLFVLRQLTSVLTRNDWRNDRNSIFAQQRARKQRAVQSAKCGSATGTWGRGCGGVNSEPLIGTANPLSAHQHDRVIARKDVQNLQARNSFYSKNVLEGSQFGKPQMMKA